MGSNIRHHINACVLDNYLEVKLALLMTFYNWQFQFKEGMHKEKGSIHFTLSGRYDNKANLEKEQKYLARAAEIH